MVIHAYGKVKIHDDERYVRGVVARLTRTHEATQAEPWKMSDAPKDYLEPMLKEIVGIEIKITKLQGKAKTRSKQRIPRCFRCRQCLNAKWTACYRSAMHQVAASKKHSL